MSQALEICVYTSTAFSSILISVQSFLHRKISSFELHFCVSLTLSSPLNSPSSPTCANSRTGQMIDPPSYFRNALTGERTFDAAQKKTVDHWSTISLKFLVSKRKDEKSCKLQLVFFACQTWFRRNSELAVLRIKWTAVGSSKRTRLIHLKNCSDFNFLNLL